MLSAGLKRSGDDQAHECETSKERADDVRILPPVPEGGPDFVRIRIGRGVVPALTNAEEPGTKSGGVLIAHPKLVHRVSDDPIRRVHGQQRKECNERQGEFRPGCPHDNEKHQRSDNCAASPTAAPIVNPG